MEGVSPPSITGRQIASQEVITVPLDDHVKVKIDVLAVPVLVKHQQLVEHAII